MKNVRVEVQFELTPVEVQEKLRKLFELVLSEEQRIERAKKQRDEWLGEILTVLETEGFDSVVTQHAGTFYVRRGSKTTVSTKQVWLNLLRANVDIEIVKQAWKDAKATKPLETVCVHRKAGEEEVEE